MISLIHKNQTMMNWDHHSDLDQSPVCPDPPPIHCRAFQTHPVMMNLNHTHPVMMSLPCTHPPMSPPCPGEEYHFETCPIQQVGMIPVP